MKRELAALGLLLGGAVPWAGCSQQATTVPVRSLERSGRAAFVCLRDRTLTSPGAELDTCFTPATTYTPDIFVIPHLIGLVTQTARGEVAVVDVTSQAVLDTDPTVPGYNFFPVGAIPTDIVATPGGNASFVGSGDPLRPGIFAIPSFRIPYQVGGGKPSTLASWPACYLDAAPTELVVVGDQTGKHPERCDAVPATAPSAGYDLTNESVVFGRLKIIALLPDALEKGQVVVIDAQELLARPPGSFDPCPIERRIGLEALPGTPQLDAGSDVPPSDAPVTDAPLTDAPAEEGGALPDGGAGAGSVDDAGPDVDLSSCSGRVTPSPRPSLDPHPASMALSDDGRLFISDDRASVIHVVDVTDPCAIVERAPLLPYSATDPTRTVVTSAIAVSPLTSDMKRFVYAVDAKGGGNLMVFDVSSDSTERRPLLRSDRLFNPNDAPDRITFSAPVQSLTFATHETPLGNPSTSGVIPRGVKCDPTVAATATDNPAWWYRPVDFTQGAGPRRLRGTFGFVALSNGRISVVDVDDYDEACRRPAVSDDRALGCPDVIKGLSFSTPLPSAAQSSAAPDETEASCNVVEPHRIRSGQFFANATNAGRHAPAMQSFPLLFDAQGTVLPNDRTRPESVKWPRLLGPSLVNKSADTRILLASVTGSVAVPESTMDNELVSDPTRADRNWVSFDLREPRAHREQAWVITYEGIIPPLSGRRGRLQCLADKKATECESGDNPSSFVLYDSSVGFCDQGAQGVELAAKVAPGSGADIVQIIENLPDPADPYWQTVAGVCSHATCETAYGTTDALRDGREFPVDTSYQDRLVLQRSSLRDSSGAPAACCFPYPVSYVVRAGKQWLVTAAAPQYMHHVIPDPTAPNPSTARCVLSCDPALALRNSRAVGLPLMVPDPADQTKLLPRKVPILDDPLYQSLSPDQDPAIFQNAQIRFVIWNPVMCADGSCVPRDTYFGFVETGGFMPMEIGLSTIPVLTQSIRFVRGIDQLAIADAVTQGLMLFDLNVLSANGVRSFY